MEPSTAIRLDARLAWLVRKGRLPAVKRGRRWLATIAAVEHYRQEVEEQAIPRGRPPKQA